MMMGRYLTRGLVGEPDMEEGLIWYRKAEAAGLAQASADMAQLKFPLREAKPEADSSAEKPATSTEEAQSADSHPAVG